MADAKAIGAFHKGSTDRTPCIMVWASGFAGDTVHASICWRPAGWEISPNTQISGDTATTIYNPAHKPMTSKHLEEHWYLERDDG